MDIDILQRQPRYGGLLGIEKVTVAYVLFTALLILLFGSNIREPVRLLTGRALVLSGMACTGLFYRLRPCRATRFLRNLYPLTLLGYWYPDTYEFCQVFPNLDHLFATADQRLFGGQPALTFAQVLPGKLWSELFHMGYFSYYPMIFITVLAPLVTDRRLFEPTAFVVLTAFMLYYLIYLFLPVAGPQYYFRAVGPEAVDSGLFPHLGDYFRYHTELRPSPGPDGFFREMVEQTQASGERPTAAFPSSHVGMSTVLMLLLWRNRWWLACAAAPFYVLLCCSTVYIEAHYLVDVFGGLLTAVLFYRLCLWLYGRPFFGGARSEPEPTAKNSIINRQ